MSTKVMRCAIYTRKSSDEGLEQSFNSLDAQREAGEAYVLSQASEGWTLLPARYDDGGYSGGTMERPGLKQLLADIAAGKVDIVVVYKIDRLTRSLADFARIVETFDGAGCSFVAVTQSFNTTNSMGRLMLNVLLSFAQFEREVTGERIRDKIAASKARGMWMGGVLPLGYDLPLAGSRTLQVNESEAVTVRHMFTRYLELGSVHALQRELEQQGVCSKLRQTGTGRRLGGVPFSRGALFHLLRNQLYLGKIVHKELVHRGEHPPIVDDELFGRVQQHLDCNAMRHRAKRTTSTRRAMLTAKLFDAGGEPMSPTTSRGKSGRKYRYYVSASLQQGRGTPDNTHAGKHGAKQREQITRRLPALTIERTIGEALGRWLPHEVDPLSKLAAVRLTPAGLAVELNGVRPARVAGQLASGEELVLHEGGDCSLHLPFNPASTAARRQIVSPGTRASRPDPILVAALRRAHALLTSDRGRPLISQAPASPYERRILRLALLAPDLQRDILLGHHPAGLNLEMLVNAELPLAWSQQRAALGWA